MAVAIAMALGLSACGGGGGGGNGNVRPATPPPSTPPATPPASGGTPFTGEVDVPAGETIEVADVIGGSLDLVKHGAGTLVLSGDNAYTGATLVNAGGLYVNGDQSAAKGATQVAGGATLGGAGTLGGDVTLADGATLSPGDRGRVGTLAINGNLTLSAGSVLDFGFGQSANGIQPGDLVNVKGNLTLDGVLNVGVAAGGDLGPGVHRLFSYGGALVDNGLTQGSMPSSGWVVQTGVAHEVNLVDTRGMVFSYWDGDAGPKGNNVIDGGDGTWSAGAANTNWTDASGAVNAAFSSGSFAVFQGSAGRVTVDGTQGDVAVSGMQFARDGYAVRGDAIRLIGSTSDPTHASIRVGDGTANGATFRTTIASALTGDVGLTKTDLGTLVLSGANTYAGGTNVNAGVLELVAGATIGSGEVVVTNSHPFGPDTTTLKVGQGVSLANHVVLAGYGILDNSGAIGGAVGVAVDGGDSYYATQPSVLNHDGGSIRGNHAGIVYGASPGAVANASGGIIEGGDVGIDLSWNAQVTNDGAGSAIRSDGVAIRSMQSSSVRNTAGASISGTTNAIEFHAGGGVLNDGAGSSIASSTGSAVRMTGNRGSVTNTGGAIISSASTALYLEHGGDVSNGVGSTIATTGTRTGDCATIGDCAIFVASDAYVPGSSMGGEVSLSNAGSIVGSVQLIPSALNRVTLATGSTIQGDLGIGTNLASSFTLNGAAGNVQRYSQAVTGRTTFSGFLYGPGEGTWILDNDDLTPQRTTLSGGTLQLGDGGTSGSLGAKTIVDLETGKLVVNRSDDVVFDYDIHGSHVDGRIGTLVQAGTGTLTLTRGNDLNAIRIDIQRGTLQIGQGAPPSDYIGGYYVGTVHNEGALVFDAPNVFAGTISGAGSVTQNGPSALHLEGQNSYTGGTTINSGSVRAAYTLPGDVMLAQGATLSGAERGIYPGVPGVAGNLDSAGRVAVRGGDSSIGGDYTQQATGTLLVNLGGKLAVGGKAVLDGGTLEITGADDGYVASSRTDVLTATDGVFGAFDRLVKDTGVVFTSSTINYDGNSVWLDTTGLDVTSAAAGNGVTYTPLTFSSAQRVQGAFAQIDRSIASGDGSASAEFIQAAGQFQQAPTLQSAQASLQSLSGELHAVSAAMTFEAIDASSRVLAERFDTLVDRRSAAGMWTQALSVGGAMARTGYDGVGFQLNGWLVGQDRAIGASGLAGFAFGQSEGRQQLGRSVDRNRSRNTEGMLYAGWLSGDWYGMGRLGFGYFRQDVDRRLLLGTRASDVSTDYGGNYNVAYGESGLRWNDGATRVTPYVSVEYARIDRHGFVEQGAGGFGLRSSAQALDRWQAGIGVRALRHWAFAGNRSLALNAGAAFQRTLASHGDVFDASFVGLTQWQPLTGIGLSRYRGVLNVGLEATLSERTSLTFGYDYRQGQRDQAQSVSARWVTAF